MSLATASDCAKPSFSVLTALQAHKENTSASAMKNLFIDCLLYWLCDNAISLTGQLIAPGQALVKCCLFLSLASQAPLQFRKNQVVSGLQLGNYNTNCIIANLALTPNIPFYGEILINPSRGALRM
jgi:hypothetical protein